MFAFDIFEQIAFISLHYYYYYLLLYMNEMNLSECKRQKSDFRKKKCQSKNYMGHSGVDCLHYWFKDYNKIQLFIFMGYARNILNWNINRAEPHVLLFREFVLPLFLFHFSDNCIQFYSMTTNTDWEGLSIENYSFLYWS